jgi:hypothetical protein
MEDWEEVTVSMFFIPVTFLKWKQETRPNCVRASLCVWVIHSVSNQHTEVTFSILSSLISVKFGVRAVMHQK